MVPYSPAAMWVWAGWALGTCGCMVRAAVVYGRLQRAELRALRSSAARLQRETQRG